MQDESPYAGLVTRGLAFVLDALIINLSLLAVGSAARLVFDALDIFQSVDVGHILVGGLAWICLWGLYLTAFWALTGQTPGMWWMRIVVQRLDGAPIGGRTAALRAIGTGLAVLPFFLGFLPILFTKKRRGLNDLFAGTVVVYRVFERDAAMHSGWIEASGHG